MKVKWRVKKLLRHLSDKELHIDLPHGVGSATADLAIAMGLVRIIRVDRHRNGDVETFRTALKITKQGRVALER